MYTKLTTFENAINLILLNTKQLNVESISYPLWLLLITPNNFILWNNWRPATAAKQVQEIGHFIKLTVGWSMVFNATFSNISVINSWRSVLLVEETGEPGENHWPVVSHWQTLIHNVAWSTPRHEQDSNSQL